MNIAFIVPYPRGQAPSQRFRFEQQLEYLEEKETQYKFFPFLSEKAFSILYKKGNSVKKILFILQGFFNRTLLMFQLKKYDFVFIHREASPIGPPIFEWIISKMLKKKIIYDFDDAIWLANTSETNKIVANIKWHSKVSIICKWSYKVSCGNDYLKSFAEHHNKNTFVIPTTVDMELVHNQVKNQNTEEIVIGWTGTHSTIKYLFEIEDLLFKVQTKNPFQFIVISNKDPQFEKLKYSYIPWNKETEINDLLKFNIGIMPLTEDKWSKGKCGFKAIQYMSLGIPAVVSNVGVNSKIVDNNINGFVCQNNSDWMKSIENLISDYTLRKNFGQLSNIKISTCFSKNSQKNNFLNLFSFPF